MCAPPPKLYRCPAARRSSRSSPIRKHRKQRQQNFDAIRGNIGTSLSSRIYSLWHCSSSLSASALGCSTLLPPRDYRDLQVNSNPAAFAPLHLKSRHWVATLCFMKGSFPFRGCFRRDILSNCDEMTCICNLTVLFQSIRGNFT